MKNHAKRLGKQSIDVFLSLTEPDFLPKQSERDLLPSRNVFVSPVIKQYTSSEPLYLLQNSISAIRMIYEINYILRYPSFLSCIFL